MDNAKQQRVFDLAIAIPAAIATLPIILVLAIGSAFSFRAWPFFTQDRVGLDGKLFRFVKLRSLPASAPQTADKYQLQEVPNTRWGRFIRSSHLDELPQIWLVVAGKMSLVGPRPEMPSLSATFDAAFVTERTTVHPGCTGLWQVSTASAGLIGEAPEFDLYYVRNRTLRMDLWLVGWTLVKYLGGTPIKDVGQVPTWTGAASPERLDRRSESS